MALTVSVVIFPTGLGTAERVQKKASRVFVRRMTTLALLVPVCITVNQIGVAVDVASPRRVLHHQTGYSADKKLAEIRDLLNEVYGDHPWI